MHFRGHFNFERRHDVRNNYVHSQVTASNTRAHDLLVRRFFFSIFAKKFPAYGFEKHKGYGTRAHYEAIKKNGITKHHRKSFLKGLV
jgi:hypothetical protein